MRAFTHFGGADADHVLAVQADLCACVAADALEDQVVLAVIGNGQIAAPYIAFILGECGAVFGVLVGLVDLAVDGAGGEFHLLVYAAEGSGFVAGHVDGNAAVQVGTHFHNIAVIVVVRNGDALEFYTCAADGSCRGHGRHGGLIAVLLVVFFVHHIHGGEHGGHAHGTGLILADAVGANQTLLCAGLVLIEEFCGDGLAENVQTDLADDLCVIAGQSADFLSGSLHAADGAVGTLLSGAGEQAHSAQTQHGNAVAVGVVLSGQRQSAVFILQQNGALAGNIQTDGCVVFQQAFCLQLVVAVTHTDGLGTAVFTEDLAVLVQLHQRQVTCHAEAIEHVAGSNVNILFHNAALLQRQMQTLVGVVGAVRHFHIHALMYGQSVVGAPVGHHVALVVPHITENCLLHVFVGGGVSAVVLVVCAHKGAGLAFLGGGFKAGEVDLMEGLLVHKLIGSVLNDGVLAADSKVLQGCHNVLILNALGFGYAEGGDQEGIFAQHIAVTVELGGTDDIELTAQLGVAGNGIVFAALYLAVLVGQLGIPCSGQHFLYRKAGGVIQGGNACRAVVHTDLGNAQTGYAGVVAAVAFDAAALGVTMAEIHLFFQGHFCQQGSNLFAEDLIRLNANLFGFDVLWIFHWESSLKFFTCNSEWDCRPCLAASETQIYLIIV